MDKLIYFHFLCSFLIANSFDEWVDKNKELFEEVNKSVAFEIIIDNNRSQALNGKIIIGDNKQFRFEMGSRTVVSDGRSWKSYDARTNQVFIQDRDVRFEKLLFSWSGLKKIKSLKVKEQTDGSYKVKFSGNKNIIQVYINSSTFALDSILVSNKNRFKSKIFNISMFRVDSMALDIGLESSEFFDFR
jgi:outer membrane lipoprotein-sorting protein